jgi:hypothetical protein
MMFASDDVVWISWQFSSDEHVPSLRHTNEVIGAFVTAGARIHLYSYLNRLQDKAIYSDTGSCMYIRPNEGLPLVETGDKLGEMIEMYGRIHSDICNVPKFLLPDNKLQIKFKKAKPSFHLMNPEADTKTVFKFLDAKRFVKRFKANPHINLAHEETLKTDLARYNMTRVEFKTFTFSSGPQSLSIDQAVTGRLPKRLLFTMVENKDFLGTINTNPYKFQYFGLRTLTMFVNGRQVPSETLTIDSGHEKTTTLAYKTLFEGSGIHHAISGLQITYDMYINWYFMLLFDLTPDLTESERHTSPIEPGNIRIELTFKEALKEAITCLLYLEYDNSVRVDSLKTVTTDFKTWTPCRYHVH